MKNTPKTIRAYVAKKICASAEQPIDSFENRSNT